MAVATAAALDGRVLDLVMAAMSDLEEGHQVWPRLFAELTSQLGVTLGGVVDVHGQGLDVRAVAVWPDWAAEIEVTEEENRAYPLIRHYVRRSDAAPRTLDDVLDDYRWRTAARFDRMRRQFGGASRHLMLPLHRTARSVRLFGIARPGGNFTATELQYAGRLQRILTALDRHQQVVLAWRAGCATDLPQAGERVAGHGLTPRELAVLSLLAEGLTVAAAGRRLGISPRTVAKHQENLQRKLATTDRLNTVLRAQRLGLVRPDREGTDLDPVAHCGHRRAGETLRGCG
ncbi:response regulator transcription factor [Actinoplanes sp. NPDC048988]|uniref:helix-turn-helix transcriptional regulator n=1 Tax=Actinoplanes sp. NPDC048988 TaxID=3363901 RepID=UPI0037230B98